MARQLPQLKGVKHRFEVLDGMRTHVAVAGDGDPVVLLHGWPQHWYAWRAVMPLLAERYRVLAPDMRGFGWTDIAWKGFEKENLADDVVRLLDAMELDRVRIVGHDWGGWIGFLLALRHPGRVRQLVALNVPPPWPRVTPRNVLAARRLWYQVVLATPYLGQKLLEKDPSLVRRLMRRWSQNGSAWSKDDFRIFSRELRAPTRARAAMLLYRSFLLKELVPVLRGRYDPARLEVPSLLLYGGRDRVVPARWVTGTADRSERLEIEKVGGAGHFLPEEKPKVVARRALRFFEEAGSEA
jgi:pimeloyl-ACP methyl ester carboxylesterase